MAKLRKPNATVSGTIRGRSNNSFNASGISLDFIARLGDSIDASRRVNSGVRLPNGMVYNVSRIYLEVKKHESEIDESVPESTGGLYWVR